MAAALLAADKTPEKIAIVDLDAPPGMLGLQTQVLKSIINEAMKTRRSVMTPDELRERLGNKTLNELSKCADKPACAADKLTVLGATKAITGKLNRDDKNYILQLYFVDLVNLTVIADVDRNILIASRRFQKDVDEAIPGLLRGEREAVGTLVINAVSQNGQSSANAQVTINGEFMGVAPLTEKLKPGKYEVKVEKPKFLPVKRLVNVEPNQQTVEEFRMLLIPGQREEEDVAPMAAKAAAEEEKGSGFSPSAPTWVLGVATVLAFGGGVAFGLMAKGGYDELVRHYDPASDTYSGTRQQALDAQRNALIANVFYGVSAAALVATIVAIIFDVKRPADGDTDVEVTPAATPGGGGLIIGGRF